MPYLFDNPGASHVDGWGLTLLIAAALALGLGTIWTWQLHAAWRHHPYRVLIQGHLRNAALATAAFLGVAAVAHLLGWPAWGTPVFGAIGVLLIIATIVIWRWSFLPQLRRFEALRPEFATPHAKLPRAKAPAAEMPLLSAIGAGFTAYFIFLWHPWNHVFHLGLWLVGPLVGLAAGSLVASKLNDDARLLRDTATSRSAKRKRH
jgi:hypothetical protein